MGDFFFLFASQNTRVRSWLVEFGNAPPGTTDGRSRPVFRLPTRQARGRVRGFIRAGLLKRQSGRKNKETHESKSKTNKSEPRLCACLVSRNNADRTRWCYRTFLNCVATPKSRRSLCTPPPSGGNYRLPVPGKRSPRAAKPRKPRLSAVCFFQRSRRRRSGRDRDRSGTQTRASDTAVRRPERMNTPSTSRRIPRSESSPRIVHPVDHFGRPSVARLENDPSAFSRSLETTQPRFVVVLSSVRAMFVRPVKRICENACQENKKNKWSTSAFRLVGGTFVRAESTNAIRFSRSQQNNNERKR